MRGSGKRLLRTGLLVVAGAATVLTGVMFARAMTLPLRVVTARPVFDYEQNSSIDYRVNLLPSPLYDQEVLGPGSAYFLNLVKNIEVHFGYVLRTDPPAAVECTYSVVGTLRVYDTLSKDAVVIWSRQYNLLPEAIAVSDGGEIRLDNSLVVDLGQYGLIVEEIYRLTEVKPARAAMTLEWTVVARTPEGISVAEPARATLVIPVAAKYFTISGEPTVQAKGSFTVSEETAHWKAIADRRNWGIAFGVSVAFLLGSALLVRYEGEDKSARVLRGVIARFGTRLARSPTTELPGPQVVDLVTADDLLRVADEMGKPVIYVHGDAAGGPHVFYVLDGDTRYQFVLRL